SAGARLAVPLGKKTQAWWFLASVAAHQVQEEPAVVVVEVGQVVAEVGEVPAYADPEMLTDIPVDADQETLAVTALGDAEPAVLGERMPAVGEAVTQLAGGKGRRGVGPGAGQPAHADFAFPAHQLAGKLPARVRA